MEPELRPRSASVSGPMSQRPRVHMAAARAAAAGVAQLLGNVAVLNYLGEARASEGLGALQWMINQHAVQQRIDAGAPQRVLGQAQAATVRYGNAYAHPQAIAQIGRVTRDQAIGQCDHCACAVATALRESAAFRASGARLEIVGTGTHAFVVVGRQPGALTNIHAWGVDAFVVDIWNANQGITPDALIDPQRWAWLITAGSHLRLLADCTPEAV